MLQCFEDPFSDMFLSTEQGLGPAADVNRKDIKSLPPILQVEIYEMFKDWHEVEGYDVDSVPSLSTLLRAWTGTWKTKLRIGGYLENAKCKECERLRAERQVSTTSAQRKEIQVKLRRHWQGQQADRIVYKCLRENSARYCRAPAKHVHCSSSAIIPMQLSQEYPVVNPNPLWHLAPGISIGTSNSVAFPPGPSTGISDNPSYGSNGDIGIGGSSSSSSINLDAVPTEFVLPKPGAARQSFGICNPEESCLSMIRDGADQAKFKIPRNLEMATHFTTFWRPQLHLAAVLVHGLMDIYFAADENLKKDADTSVQELSEALELAEAALFKKGKCLPAHLCIQMDNTPRENKNQLLLKWAASLASGKKFKSVSLHFLRVGHTHEDVDRRFKLIANELTRRRILQTPMQFLEAVQHAIKKTGVHVETRLTHSTWDWWRHFEDIQISPFQVTNHVRSDKHAFRLFEFQGTPKEDEGGTAIEEFNKDNCESREMLHGDIVLGVKYWMSSTISAQSPVCIIPRSWRTKLVPGSLPKHVAEHRPPKYGLFKEFRKTAVKIAEEPWCMTEAATYLTNYMWGCEQKLFKCPTEVPNIFKPNKQLLRWPLALTLTSGLAHLVPLDFKPVKMIIEFRPEKKRKQLEEVEEDGGSVPLGGHGSRGRARGRGSRGGSARQGRGRGRRGRGCGESSKGVEAGAKGGGLPGWRHRPGNRVPQHLSSDMPIGLDNAAEQDFKCETIEDGIDGSCSGSPESTDMEEAEHGTDLEA